MKKNPITSIIIYAAITSLIVAVILKLSGLGNPTVIGGGVAGGVAGAIASSLNNKKNSEDS